MKEEDRLRLKEQIPFKMKLDGAVDYPNDSIPHAIVMGQIGKYGIKITWNYISDPNDVYVQAMGISNVELNNVIPLTSLKDTLLKLI